jgi:holo-[acyl-carrier protein] synthase
MKIIGIGTDIVAIQRIQTIWDRFGLAFPKRILSPVEISSWETVKDPVSFLAKRYAAKEAAAKALGTGFRPQGVLLTDISVVNNALGRPHLVLSGGAKHEWERQLVVESHLSLADEKEFAVAFVILMGE